MLTEHEKKLFGIKPWGDNPPPQDQGEHNWHDLSINYNDLPQKTDTAIIVTGWRGHLKWLKAVLTQYRLTGKFIILAWDNPFYAFGLRDYSDYYIPRPQVLILSHAFVMKHITFDCNKRTGHFFNLRYAEGIIKQFENIKYVWDVNGDGLWEKPEGVDEIHKLMGDADVMASSQEGTCIHTCSIVYKRDAFHKIMDNWFEKMRVPVMGSRSTEVCVYEAIDELKLKVKEAPEQPLHPDDGTRELYHRYNQDSTWKKILGFRNLDHEMQYLAVERRETPGMLREYADIYNEGMYLNDHEKRTIYHYYVTGDRRWIYMFWDQGCDSDYDRRYYELEYYGKEPIYEE